MKLLVFVLSKIEKLDDLLIELSKNKITGATILKSVGMATSIYNNLHKDKSYSLILESLKILLNNKNNENVTIFAVVDEKQEKIFFKVVEEVVGSISKQNTGIIFTIKIDSIFGLHSWLNALNP